MMKDGAYLVNTARGMLVDEAALKEALVSGKLGGAALDVYEKEPITADNPLFALRSNTVLSPHVAALTFETNYQAGITASESIIRVLGGGEAGGVFVNVKTVVEMGLLEAVNKHSKTSKNILLKDEIDEICKNTDKVKVVHVLSEIKNIGSLRDEAPFYRQSYCRRQR